MTWVPLVLMAANASAGPGGPPAKAALRAPLWPGMAPVPQPGVPLLGDGPPDADRVARCPLRLESRRPYHWVFAPGDAAEILVSCKADDRIEGAALTAWDWEERPVWQTQLATPGEAEVRFEVRGRGTYLLTLDGMHDGRCAFRLVRSFAVCPPNDARRAAWKDSGFWIGQCSFPGWQGARLEGGPPAHTEGLTEQQARDLDADLVTRMGAQVARINFPVFRRDESGLDLDFTLADQCVEAFASQGLALDLQLFGPVGPGRGPVLPAYAAAPVEVAPLCPLQEAPYRHFVGEVSRRYGRHAQFFQIGNEPGNEQQYKGAPEEYVAAVHQAADEVRRVWPQAVVTNGGYCNTGEAVRQIAAGLRGATDFVSYHYHADLPGLKAFFSDIEAAHREAGYTQVRYANTETGYAMPTVAQETTNAACEMQKLLWCWAHGHEGVLLYSSRELWWPRQFSYNGISDYGFVDHFFCPRFVYGAASALLDHGAGFRFEETLRESAGVHAYLFRRDRRCLVALFTTGEPALVTVLSDARQASLIDPMGNAGRVADARRVALTLKRQPRYVRLAGATRVRLEP